MKRSLKFLLVFIVVLSSVFSASFAQTTTGNPFLLPEDAKIEILKDLTPEEEKLNQILIKKNSLLRGPVTPVAEISIFATASGIASSTNQSGHTWLYIYNWSNSSFTIGKKVVAPKTGITIGTFGNDYRHKGVWYNYESQFPSVNNVSYTSEITATDITKISNYVKINDRWTILYNCSHFAAGAWNSTSISKKFSGGTPSQVIPQIKNTGSYIVDKAYPCSGSVSY